MKNIKIFLLVGLCFFSVTAFADNSFSHLKPYLGAELGLRDGGYKSGLGNNVFKKNNPNVGVFFGVMFNEFIGAELGYESTFKKKRNVTLPARTTLLGLSNALVPLNSRSSSKISGVVVSVVGKKDIDYGNVQGKLSVLGKIGMKLAKAELKNDIFSTVNGLNIDRVVLKKSKAILKISGGLQYAFTEQFSARALVSFEDSSSIKISKLSNGLLLNPQRRSAELKDAFTYSLGVAYHFV